MRCKYCQSEIEKDAKFCPNCGKELASDNRCIKCGELLEEDSEFCPYCGERQGRKTSEKPSHKPKAKSSQNSSFSVSNKWIMLLMALLLGILVYLLFFQSCEGDKRQKNLEQEEEVLENDEKRDSINRQRAMMEQQFLEDSLMRVAKSKSDSLAYLKDSLEKGKRKNPQKELNDSKPKPTPSTSSTRRSETVITGSKNLGYATFKGFLRNGVPHDVNGRLIFKTNHLIDSRDPKGRVAEPGDYVIGEFYGGHLVQGIWYDANNQVKGSIIIGK